MAVRGIGIERDVGQHADFRRGVLDRLDRAADEIVGVERFLGSSVRSSSGVLGNSAMQGMPSAAASLRLRAEPVDAPAADARQRADRLLAIAAVADEQRPDEVARVQPVLGEHRAHPRARPAAAHAQVGKGSGHGPPLSFRSRVRHPAGLSGRPARRVASASSTASSSSLGAGGDRPSAPSSSRRAGRRRSPARCWRPS